MENLSNWGRCVGQKDVGIQDKTLHYRIFLKKTESMMKIKPYDEWHLYANVNFVLSDFFMW